MPPIARRALRLLATLWVVTTLSFLMIKLLPGDPVLQIVGPQYATEERLAEVREELGFDDPLPVQYGAWVGGAVQGDLGRSYRTSQSVSGAIVDRLPLSVELILAAQLVAVVGALVLAPLGANRPGGWVDRLLTVSTSGFIAVPAFTLGLALIFLLAARLQLFPASGYVPWSESVWGHLRSMTLPAFTLAAVPFAIYARALRNEMVATLGQEFILLARSRGISSWRLLVGHALRPSVLPMITLIGINMGTLIGGAVIVEAVFSLPGLGRLLIDSINGRDYLMVQGVVVFITVTYVLVNALVDATYAVIDPRIRV